VLRSRVPTTGIIEYKFQDGDTVFRYAGPALGFVVLGLAAACSFVSVALQPSHGRWFRRS
jgi:hypothetical protein